MKDLYIPKTMMNRSLFLERCAQGAMLGVFLYRLTGETEWKRSTKMEDDYWAKQERAVANRVIWC